MKLCSQNPLWCTRLPREQNVQIQCQEVLDECRLFDKTQCDERLLPLMALMGSDGWYWISAICSPNRPCAPDMLPSTKVISTTNIRADWLNIGKYTSKKLRIQEIVSILSSISTNFRAALYCHMQSSQTIIGIDHGKLPHQNG